jgi:hypothetical protein
MDKNKQNKQNKQKKYGSPVGSGKLPRPIGTLSEEELLEEFKKAISENSDATMRFVITWCLITDKGNLIKEEYPEYFL